jgi:integrase
VVRGGPQRVSTSLRVVQRRKQRRDSLRAHRAAAPALELLSRVIDRAPQLPVRVVPAGARAEAGCDVGGTPHWLDASGVRDGALFRSVHRSGKAHGRMCGEDIAHIVKLVAESAGLDPAQYSGHSLRAGLATSAARAGKADRDIMRQGRWSGRAMVDRYVRGAKLLDKDNAAAGIGL